MDNRIYKKLNRLENYDDLYLAFKDSIIKTNLIIDRWININSINPKRIYDEDIRGLLIGQLKKSVFYDRHIDFKRVNKNLHVSTYLNTRKISNITLTTIDVYWNDKEFVDIIDKIVNNLPYLELDNTVIFNNNIQSDKANEDIILDLEKINEIKF